jgi:hypothetical protein
MARTTASMTDGGGPAKKAKPVVSQATINRIKQDGMSSALKRAAASANRGTNAAYVEGVKRMYGATRLNAAKAKLVSGGSPAGYRNKPAQYYSPGQPSGYRSKATQAPKVRDRGSMSR